MECEFSSRRKKCRKLINSTKDQVLNPGSVLHNNGEREGDVTKGINAGWLK